MVPDGRSSVAAPGALPVTVQPKDTVAEDWPSDTVALTVVDPDCVGVPLMMPVACMTVRPAGSPVTVYVSGAPSGSTPESDRLSTWPIGLVWSPGLASVGAAFPAAHTSLDRSPS